ncbi:hypothetical protein AYO21_03204 [Fonsecaea monophora]|uniref:EthD domain-containing protein n=1 Tax=Fonsecaea monophora TaxID=254056 RepID=A0A177FHF5_9EURO|nr:hypothetical protein AYO21_03204 [Fonsecaea monophora]OAG42619.1 hypothetical protein AYO21_03204 [Fonsecaea monophora]
MPQPGLAVAFARPKKGTDHPLSKLHQWYEEVHIPDILATSGINDAYRYENVDPNSEWPLLALYPVADVDFFSTQEFNSIPPLGKHVFPGPITDHIEFQVRQYRLTQVYEPRDIRVFAPVPKQGAPVIATAAVQPKAGGEDDFDTWYRQQHLDMLSMIIPYRAATRYEQIDPANKPRYLTIHEFDSTDIPGEQIRRSSTTEWAKRVLGSVQSMEGYTWKLTRAYGPSTTFKGLKL